MYTFTCFISIIFASTMTMYLFTMSIYLRFLDFYNVCIYNIGIPICNLCLTSHHGHLQ